MTESNDSMTAVEAAREMVLRYKNDHPMLGFIHIFLILATGGAWACFFLGKWYVIWTGSEDTIG